VAKLRIIVADDNPLILQNLVLLLAAEFDVVATAADGKSALDLIRRFQPDLAVLDLHIPRMDGIEITRELAQHAPRPAVVICAIESDLEIVKAAQGAGATGYVSKTRLRKDLILAVKSAAQGKSFVSPAPR